MSSKFGQFTYLTHLNLSSSSFSGLFPIEISKLAKLVSVDLSNNTLKLEQPNFVKFLQNLTEVRDLVLDFLDMSLVAPGSLLFHYLNEFNTVFKVYGYGDWCDNTLRELFARKISDPGCTIRPKDIITKVREQHDINLKYNKAYRSKNHTLNTVVGILLHVGTIQPWTVTKIETDSENRFAYGFMSLRASIAGFNEVIRPVIVIDATHLKAKTRGCFICCGM
ncbi:hypothetical protein Ddye_005343 [Dipteronia dyeriana]|uniref:Uncharacterized protein n=1 Tax=Dipteronia dyeriana TaxID=168575 RepID=A0AAE0CPJ2_9ROSI|nr:hypothetical protein Ddye_005343 [Dipteronia dyeriana]